MKNKILLFALALSLIGCTSVASVSHLPQRSSDLDFDQIEQSHDDSSGFIWTWKGKNEYFLSAKTNDEDFLKEQLVAAINRYGYSIVRPSKNQTEFLGKKGIRLNEWGSVVGVYFRKKNDIYQIYIKVEITQDITGGWQDNRAMRLGRYFCRETEICVKNA